MEKRMRQKIPKLRSRKGMTLVELIIGIVIIVIVFGSTLSAMTNGYSNTIFNADVNRTAVEGGSVNEIMAQTIKKQNFEDEAACRKYFFGGDGAPAKLPNSENAVHAAGEALLPDLQYVAPDNFPSPEYENQYTIVTNSKSTLKTTGAKSYDIKGVTLMTSVTNVRGKLTNSSFIAYASQTTT